MSSRPTAYNSPRIIAMTIRKVPADTTASWRRQQATPEENCSGIAFQLMLLSRR